MQINWLKYSPTENMTALVVTPVDESSRIDVAHSIMTMDPEIEQVGFITEKHWTESTVRLEMAGGEFCGNASMCAAAYAMRGKMESGDSQLFPIECAGAEDFIVCFVREQTAFCEISIDMPLPENVETVVLSYGGNSYQLPIVRFTGITHAIMPYGSLTHSDAEKAVREWAEIEKADAMGIVFYNSAAGYIEPVVYVPAANTLCWERGCGSGSAALGVFLSSVAKTDLITDVRQPGGIIKVRCDWRDDKPVRVSINSRVELLGEYTLAY